MRRLFVVILTAACIGAAGPVLAQVLPRVPTCKIGIRRRLSMRWRASRCDI